MGKKLSTKKWKKMEFFTFINVCISFQPITFLSDFLHFYQQIWTEHRILRFYGAHNKYLGKKILILFSLFANFKAQKAQNNEKRILQMWLSILFYIYLRSRRLHFVKKTTIVVP